MSPSRVGIEQPKTETSAGQISVHIVPTYLVAGQDYFDDRAAMNAVIDKSILEVIQTPSLPHKVSGDPKFRYSEIAENESRSLATYEMLARRHPERVAAGI
jgi:hypothetical protein